MSCGIWVQSRAWEVRVSCCAVLGAEPSSTLCRLAMLKHVVPCIVTNSYPKLKSSHVKHCCVLNR